MAAQPLRKAEGKRAAPVDSTDQLPDARQEITKQASRKSSPPINSQNRIVGDKICDPKTSPLWGDVAYLCNDAKKPAPGAESYWRPFLKLKSIGKTSIICDVYASLLADSGRVESKPFLKTILIYHHPAHEFLTTGEIIGGFGRSSATRNCIAMRVENWRTNDLGVGIAADSGGHSVGR